MPVGSGLFILNGGTLTPMAEAPYDNENALQQLLAEHPELLPGDAIDPDNPRRFILVGREVQVAGYRVDHLFIDHEAVPTLVETKLEANREIRRLVVAQMLDYAANAASEWDAAKLSGWLADIAGDTDALASLDHQFETDDEFWAQAEQNVRDGKVRLLFLSSEIPDSLRRVVEFLNERMTPTEVLAAELRQFGGEGGNRILQSSLVGQTERARAVKGQSSRPSVIPLLAEHGKLQDGQELWMLPSALATRLRGGLANDDPRLRFVLKNAIDKPVLDLQPAPDGPSAELAPSAAPFHVATLLDPDGEHRPRHPVHSTFSTEPGGTPLGKVATAAGLWQ
ncbi:MAG: hypothetical protein ABI611_12935 [Solirubrobacteraceae bacterium]